MKKSLARDLNDKVLYTDADMNAADWQTGLAGIAGVVASGSALVGRRGCSRHHLILRAQ